MRRAAFILSFVISAAMAQASWTQAADRASLGADDMIDWGQFGPELSGVASGATGTTDGGIGFTLYSANEFDGLDDGGGFLTAVAGSSWGSTFNVGDELLYHANEYPSDILLVFDQNIAGFGFDSCTNAFGQFLTQYGAWSTAPFTFGSDVGFGSDDGFSGPSGDFGHAPFTGGVSSATNVKAVYITARMFDGSGTQGYAINNMSIVTEAVPEPASMAVLGLGLAAIAKRKRK
jgi:hypothetical protein